MANGDLADELTPSEIYADLLARIRKLEGGLEVCVQTEQVNTPDDLPGERALRIGDEVHRGQGANFEVWKFDGEKLVQIYP